MLEENKLSTSTGLGPVYHALPGNYALLNLDFSVIDATDAYLRCLQLKREEITGQPIAEVLPPRLSCPKAVTAASLLQSFQEVMHTRQPHTLANLCSRYINGKETYWTIRNTPVLNDAGELLHILHELCEVTERIAFQQRRQDDSDRLSLLINSMGVVSWEYAIVENKLTWGPGLAEVFGYQPEELGSGGEAWDELVHPNDFKSLSDSIAGTIAAGDHTWSGEYRLKRKDGTYAYVLDQSTIVYNAEGRALRSIGFIIDISQSKLAEQALKESDARSHQLIDLLPHMAWTAAPNGRVLHFNQSWYRYTGMPEGQTIGWANMVHPEDTTIAITAWNEAIATGDAFEAEYRLRSQLDGSYRWFVERGLPMHDEQGKIKLWLGTYTDIEDQKQTLEQLLQKDEELERLLNLSPAHLCVFSGPNFICKFATSGLYKLYGSRQFIGRSALDIWPEFLPLGFGDLLNQVYHNGDIARINEFRTPIDRFQDGDVKDAYFNFKYRPLYDNNGNCEGVLVSAIEVTELVMAKRKAEALAKQLTDRQ